MVGLVGIYNKFELVGSQMQGVMEKFTWKGWI